MCLACVRDQYRSWGGTLINVITDVADRDRPPSTAVDRAFDAVDGGRPPSIAADRRRPSSTAVRTLIKVLPLLRFRSRTHARHIVYHASARCSAISSVRPRPHQQQCQATGNTVEATFDFVATNGDNDSIVQFRPFDKVECCFDIVAVFGNNVAGFGNNVE